MDSLARICVESIRTAGHFDGRMILFSDHEIDIGHDVEVRIVPRLTDWREACEARIALARDLDASRYDEIAYLDLDTLSTAPIEPLFSDLDALRAMPEPLTLRENHTCHGGLTDDERQRATMPSVCAGVFAVNADLFPDVMQTWATTCAALPPVDFREQHALNAMVFRQSIPFRAYDDEIVVPHSAEATYAERPLLHFWASYKVMMPAAWAAWRQRHQRYEQAQFVRCVIPRRCDSIILHDATASTAV